MVIPGRALARTRNPGGRASGDAVLDSGFAALCAAPRNDGASISLRDRHRGRMPIHPDVAGLLGDALEPGADGGESGEVEVAFIGDVGIAVERDVGDGVAVGGEEAMGREM